MYTKVGKESLWGPSEDLETTEDVNDGKVREREKGARSAT